MTAYRLHFEAANLRAVEIVKSGRLGPPQMFSSVFSMQVRAGNVRLKRELGGGPLYDIGIYCINAARYLFRSEPVEVTCFTGKSGDRRFREVEQTASAVLRFEENRIAAFTCSFGAADSASYTLVGTKGRLRLDQAYEYGEPMTLTVTIDSKTRERKFPKRDQFGPELVHFSDCVLRGKDPQPSGEEGLADVAIIEALHQSASLRAPVTLQPVSQKLKRPSMAQERRMPPVRRPRLVDSEPAHA